MKDLKKDILSRVYLVYGVVCLFAAVIFGQVLNLQFLQGEEWEKKAEALTIDYKNIKAVRGNVYASDGSLLATSVPKYEVRFDPNTAALSDEYFYKEVDSLALELSKIFPGKTKQQYLDGLVSARKKGSRYHLIKRNVKYTELKKLKQFPIFRRGKYKGGFICAQQNKILYQPIL